MAAGTRKNDVWSGDTEIFQEGGVISTGLLGMRCVVYKDRGEDGEFWG